MIVHLIGSRGYITEEIDYYRIVVKTIRDLGHEVAYDWIEDVYALAQRGRLKEDEQSWNEIDKFNEAALAKSDIVIVDATTKSFFAGYQVSQAANQKKPILILTRDLSPVAISGLSTPTGFIKSVTYTKENLAEITTDFIRENMIDTKDLRFNFVLDRPTHNYLRWKSSKTGRTRAEIIRSLIQKEMNEAD